MELLEHVPRPASVIAACARLLRPGGSAFFATVNRTWLSWLLVIVAAERTSWASSEKAPTTIVKLVQTRRADPMGPVESGLTVEDLSGLRYTPFGGHAALCRSTRMNYLMHFKRRE
jgi:2-polyprenyl-6-hydroxyphenyl methylase/3-demethylubiquinone-9 3-methyltransferase